MANEPALAPITALSNPATLPDAQTGMGALELSREDNSTDTAVTKANDEGDLERSIDVRTRGSDKVDPEKNIDVPTQNSEEGDARKSIDEATKSSDEGDARKSIGEATKSSDEGDPEKGEDTIHLATKSLEERNHVTGFRLWLIVVSLMLAIFCVAIDNTSQYCL